MLFRGEGRGLSRGVVEGESGGEMVGSEWGVGDKEIGRGELLGELPKIELELTK